MVRLHRSTKATPPLEPPPPPLFSHLARQCRTMHDPPAQSRLGGLLVGPTLFRLLKSLFSQDHMHDLATTATQDYGKCLDVD